MALGGGAGAGPGQDSSHSGHEKLLPVLTKLEAYIGIGSAMLDRLMDASLSKLKTELGNKSELRNHYKDFQTEMMATSQASVSPDDLVMRRAKASFDSGKILLACQSGTLACNYTGCK